MSVKTEIYFPEIKSNYMDKDLSIPAFLVAGLSCTQISGLFWQVLHGGEEVILIAASYMGYVGGVANLCIVPMIVR